jgi:hypothetical protein
MKHIDNQLILPSDGRLHACILKLEADQMRHLHVTLPDAVLDELESQYDYLLEPFAYSKEL